MVLISHLKQEVINAVRSLILEDFKLENYMKKFDEEVTRGLDEDTQEQATVKSIITHVNKLPTGEEEGEYLGLDFSGPQLKIMVVKLENRECTVTEKLYEIKDKYKKAKSEKLFDFIAKCLADFLSGIKLKMFRIPLGITFGFPIEQISLQNCKLIRWSKGFECNDLVGENIFVKLKNSIRKFPELKRIYIIGIVSDSVSAVLGSAWQDPSCLIGVVIGPGVSCCYAEKVSRVTKYEAETYAIRDVYINLDASSFGEDGCLDDLLSDYDKQLDEDSSNPGKQINDKLTSNEFFGELVRIILLKCIDDNLILDGNATDKLLEKNSLTLDHLTRIESDPDTSHDNCREVLTEFDYSDPTDEDCFQVQFICRCVSRRSANLVAAQIAALINRVNVSPVTIAADGEMIKGYPNYKWYLERKLKQLKNPECDFQLKEAEETSLGPVVLAAVFGKEVMDRDEKLRKLPGFPMDKCHFNKKGCMDPNCGSELPCDNSNVNPMQTPMITEDDDDITPCTCFKDKQGCGPCRGYERIDDTMND